MTNNQTFSGFIKEPPIAETALGGFFPDAQSEKKPSRPGLFTHLTLPGDAEGSPPLRQAVAIQFTAHTGRGRRARTRTRPPSGTSTDEHVSSFAKLKIMSTNYPRVRVGSRALLRGRRTGTGFSAGSEPHGSGRALLLAYLLSASG